MDFFNKARKLSIKTLFPSTDEEVKPNPVTPPPVDSDLVIPDVPGTMSVSTAPSPVRTKKPDTPKPKSQVPVFFFMKDLKSEDVRGPDTPSMIQVEPTARKQFSPASGNMTKMELIEFRTNVAASVGEFVKPDCADYEDYMVAALFDQIMIEK